MSVLNEKLESQLKKEDKTTSDLKTIHEISPILENYKVDGPFRTSIIEKIGHESLLCIHYNILGWYLGFYEQANQRMSRSIFEAASNIQPLENLDSDYFRSLHISDYQGCVERALDMGVKALLLEYFTEGKMELNTNMISKVYAETAAVIKQYSETFRSKTKQILMKKLFKQNVFDPSQMLDALDKALNNISVSESKISALAKEISEKSKTGQQTVINFLKQFSSVNPKYRLVDGWLARKDAVIAALKRDAGPNLDNTVFSLNEVSIHQYYDIHEAFKDTHTVIGFDPYKSPNAQGEYTPLSKYAYNILEGKGPDGLEITNLILIPNKRFDVLPELVKLRWISEKPDVSEKLSPPLAWRNQRNVVLEVGVRDKTSGELYFFLSTHFTAIEEGLPFSAEFLAKEIKALELKHKCPVIVLGDMNLYDNCNNKQNILYGRKAYATLLNSGLSDACAMAKSRYQENWLGQNTFDGFPYDPQCLLFNGKDTRQSHLDRGFQPKGENCLPVIAFFMDPAAVTHDMQLISPDDENAVLAAVKDKRKASDHNIVGFLFDLTKRVDKAKREMTNAQETPKKEQKVSV